MISEATFNRFILIWILIAIVVFLILRRISAPYGRTARRGWGPLVSSRFGWMIMESVAAVVFLIICLLGRRNWSVVSPLFLLLWELHYVNRAFVFPFRMKSTKKRMAASVVAMALVFNTINGCANSMHLFVIASVYQLSWLKGCRFIIGVVVFFVGFLTNVISDELLYKQKEYSGGTYRMPRGFLFRWISCPNYFGEIVEWLGWALLTWSIAGLSFFVWTCANLIPRALTYHRWYRERFPDYPLARKAIIPFVL